VGVTFLGLGVQQSTGGVTFDPTIPITDVHARIYANGIGVGHTFGLFGRESLFVASLPYAFGKITGSVGTESGEVDRSGLADMRMRFSINLHGCPAQTPREFATSPHKSLIVATRLDVEPPTGQYGSTKLINLGTNRWSFQPEIGASLPVRKFDFDLYLASWFFTENKQYYPGTNTHSENPLGSVQAHVSYTFRPSLWLAVDGTWYGGGAAHNNGGPPMERQNSTRVGSTLSIPLVKRQSAKISYSSGVTQLTGSNFTSFGVAWQYVWLH
jgi:Putative MetA-pathway of phenol degradation